MNDQQRLYELGQGRADSTEGICTAVDWAAGEAVVNTNGQERRARFAGEPPWPGDRVRVVQAGVGNLVCVTIYGAPMGTVITTASGLATVQGDDDATYQYPYRGTAPANGARVRIDHAGRCIPPGAYSVEPPGSTFTTPDAPPAVGGAATFTASWSGSWRYDVYDSAGIESSFSRVAGFGFSSTVADTIPDTATVKRAELQLTLDWNRSGSSTDIRFGSHGFGDAPGVLSAGSLSGSLFVPQGVLAVNVLAFADALKTGAVKGFGIYPNEAYWIRYSPAPNGARLYMEWE